MALPLAGCGKKVASVSAFDRPLPSTSKPFRYLAADGAYLDVFDRGSIIRYADGKALRFVGVMQDVTARKAAGERETNLWRASSPTGRTTPWRC